MGLIVEAELSAKSNPEFAEKVCKKVAEFEACQVDKIKQIVSKAGKLSMKALSINHGGWLVYVGWLVLLILPFLLFFGAVRKLKKFCNRLNSYPRSANG